MAKLHIITGTARPHLISSMITSVLLNEPHTLYLEWHFCFKSIEPDNRGMDRVNKLLDIIDDGWICFMPDDSMFHKKVLRRIDETIQSNPTAQAIVVSQERHDAFGNLHARPENMKPLFVDGNQYFLKREIIGNIRFSTLSNNLRCNDGLFINKIYSLHPEKFVFIDEILSEFNSTMWIPGEKPNISEREKRIINSRENFYKKSNHETETDSDVELCNH